MVGLVILLLLSAASWKKRKTLISVAKKIYLSLSRVGSWCSDHLIQLIAYLALPVMLGLLLRSLYDSKGEPEYQIVLFGAILATATLAQYGPDLMHRLSKVGPVEFLRKRSAGISLEFQNIFNPHTGAKEFSGKELYEYEKADLYINHLEWQGLTSEPTDNEDLFELLFRICYVALLQKHWLRAIDRSELLLRLSDNQFKAAKVHYWCGCAYLGWAQKIQGTEREEAFKNSLDHFVQALKEDPHHWPACFYLAYVQVDLEMYELARKNNKRTLEMRSGYALAKYNLAICHIKLSQQEIDPDHQLKLALDKLHLLKAHDEKVEDVANGALQDDELEPLLEHPTFGLAARECLEELKLKVDKRHAK